MKKDKAIEYVLLVIICMLTFFNLFLPNVELQKWTLAIFLVLYTIVLTKILKFKKIDNVLSFGLGNIIVCVKLAALEIVGEWIIDKS